MRAGCRWAAAEAPSLGARKPLESEEMTIEKYYTLLANAFVNDPMSQYIFGDEKKRFEIVKKVFTFMFDLGTNYGELITSGNDEGLIVYTSNYLLLNSLVNQIKKGGLKLPFSIGIRKFISILKYNNYSNLLHTKYSRKNDIYLYIIAVDPIHQRKGIGSKLLLDLQSILKKGQRIYLETSNPINIPFYEKHDFRKQEDFNLPDSNVYIWPMIYEK
jgi:ribosomal protein S18 acetylase RimI-like enzyme